MKKEIQHIIALLCLIALLSGCSYEKSASNANSGALNNPEAETKSKNNILSNLEQKVEFKINPDGYLYIDEDVPDSNIVYISPEVFAKSNGLRSLPCNYDLGYEGTLKEFIEIADHHGWIYDDIYVDHGYGIVYCSDYTLQFATNENNNMGMFYSEDNDPRAAEYTGREGYAFCHFAVYEPGVEPNDTSKAFICFHKQSDFEEWLGII